MLRLCRWYITWRLARYSPWNRSRDWCRTRYCNWRNPAMRK